MVWKGSARSKTMLWPEQAKLEAGVDNGTVVKLELYRGLAGIALRTSATLPAPRQHIINRT